MNLAALIAAVRYKPGWSFRAEYGPTAAAAGCQAVAVITGAAGITVASAGTALTAGHPDRLAICLVTADVHTGREARFGHVFAVPAAEPGAGWHRWLFDRIRDVERHEAMEAFAVGEARPFYPEHGPQARLYDVIDKGLAA